MTNCSDPVSPSNNVVITFDSNNAWNGQWTTKSATATLGTHEDKVVVTTTSAPTIITLPTIQVGREYTILNRSSTQTVTVSNTIIIDQSGSGTTIINDTIAKFVYNGTIWIRLI